MADPNVASNLVSKRKTKARGGLSTQPLSTGAGASGTGATRPPTAKPKPSKGGPNVRPVGQPVAGKREQPGRRLEMKGGPSPRAMERANPNARFKRTMPRPPTTAKRGMAAVKKLPRPIAKAKRPMYGGPRTMPRKADR